MATRYSGNLRISVVYDDRGGDYRVGVTDGTHRWRGRVRPAPAGFGAGVAYDSPRAYDEIARSALAFAASDMERKRESWIEQADSGDSDYHVGRTPATAWGSGRDRGRRTGRRGGVRPRRSSGRDRPSAQSSKRGTGTRDLAANLRKARVKVDRLLSEAQDVIGSELSNAETKTTAPRTYQEADKAFGHIERARLAILGYR